ncbi:MAG: hypothetical protein P8Y69_11075 [Gammaproteobacteria bacterium]|jgi:hypothetical protein
MHWRLSKLNWSYGIGELLIVIVGVLVALAVDQWNDQRRDRAEETEIVGRLITDLRADLERLSFGQDAISRKQVSLHRVYSSLASPNERPKNLAAFLQDIVFGAGYGWSQARALRPTFSELVASGKLDLIHDTAIRTKVVEYYDADLTRQSRIDARKTGYPDLSYALVPRSTEYEAARDLSEAQIERVFTKLADPSSRDYIVAELNFAGFLREQFNLWEDECVELIKTLESYLDAIR